MSAPLPDRWEDEPWPLDDPTPAPGLRPTNWSDSHDDPPQVADLADEAWEYALDHGVSMEQALAILQKRTMHSGGLVRHGATITIGGVDLTDYLRDVTIQYEPQINWHTTTANDDPPRRPFDRYTLDQWKPAVSDPEAHKRIDPGSTA